MIRNQNQDVDHFPPGGASFHDSYDESDFVEQMAEQLSEFKESVLELISARVAALRVAIRKQLLGGLVAVVLMTSACAFVAISAYFTLSGMAGAIGAAASSPWVGPLVTDVAGLSAAVVGLRAVCRRGTGGVRPPDARIDCDDPF